MNLIEKFHSMVDPAIEALLAELEKKCPDIRTKTYAKGGDEWTFKDRVQLCLSLELMFAGYINAD